MLWPEVLMGDETTSSDTVMGVTFSGGIKARSSHKLGVCFHLSYFSAFSKMLVSIDITLHAYLSQDYYILNYC